MTEILNNLLDDLEFFINSRKLNKDVEHIYELLQKYRNEAINYTPCSTLLKTKSERMTYTEWKAKINPQKVKDSIYKIGNDYKTVNELLEMYETYFYSF